jgi:hypothetical protein
VTSHSNESALNPIGGLFLLEPLHPRYLGWMILSECHESPAFKLDDMKSSSNPFQFTLCPCLKKEILLRQQAMNI